MLIKKKLIDTKLRNNWKPENNGAAVVGEDDDEDEDVNQENEDNDDDEDEDKDDDDDEDDLLINNMHCSKVSFCLHPLALVPSCVIKDNEKLF